MACTKSLVIDPHTREGIAHIRQTKRSKGAGSTTMVQPDFQYAPVPDKDSDAHFRNHPSSRQLEWRLGTGKQRGSGLRITMSRP